MSVTTSSFFLILSLLILVTTTIRAQWYPPSPGSGSGGGGSGMPPSGSGTSGSTSGSIPNYPSGSGSGHVGPNSGGWDSRSSNEGPTLSPGSSSSGWSSEGSTSSDSSWDSYSSGSSGGSYAPYPPYKPTTPAPYGPPPPPSPPSPPRTPAPSSSPTATPAPPVTFAPAPAGPSFAKRWSKSISSTPVAITSDAGEISVYGNIYVITSSSSGGQSGGGSIVSYSEASGALSWTYTIPPQMKAVGIVAAGDGATVIATYAPTYGGNGYVVGLSTMNGAVKWKVQIRKPTAPVVASWKSTKQQQRKLFVSGLINNIAGLYSISIVNGTVSKMHQFSSYSEGMGCDFVSPVTSDSAVAAAVKCSQAGNSIVSYDAETGKKFFEKSTSRLTTSLASLTASQVSFFRRNLLIYSTMNMQMQTQIVAVDFVLGTQLWQKAYNSQSCIGDLLVAVDPTTRVSIVAAHCGNLGSPDTVYGLDLSTGKQIWQHSIAVGGGELTKLFTDGRNFISFIQMQSQSLDLVRIEDGSKNVASMSSGSGINPPALMKGTDIFLYDSSMGANSLTCYKINLSV